MSTARPANGSDYLRWIIANGIGWLATAVFLEVGLLDIFRKLPELGGLIYLPLFVGTLFLGLFQWLVLSGFACISKWWVTASALTTYSMLTGTMNVAVVGFEGPSEYLQVGLGLCLFGILGGPLLEWLIIRGAWSNGVLWIFLCAIAIPVIAAFSFVLLGMAEFTLHFQESIIGRYPSWSGKVMYDTVVLPIRAMIAGTIYGALTGLGLFGLKVRPSSNC